MALVNVVKLKGEKRSISIGDSMGSLHVSKVKQDFLKDITTAFKICDIIRAKVIQVKPSLQLSTQEKDLGVINANCIQCQIPLSQKSKELICPKCETKSRRKIASDYGKDPKL
jgi:exosome complex component CSL4